MAAIVGCIAASRVPAIARERQREPDWKPFFDGFHAARDWLAKVRPDVAVVIFNDHGLNFSLDTMPTFAVGAAAEYRNAGEGRGVPALPPHRGDLDLSWRVIEALVAEEFDIATCQEMRVDRAFAIPMELLWPGPAPCPVRTVPVCINTVRFPLPTPARCFKLGAAVGRAVEAWDGGARVVIVGSGGLSHQLDGQRAGFINQEFDLLFMEKLVGDPLWVTRYSIPDLVELTGTQGVELLMWLAARAALPGDVSTVHSSYHLPLSNTATGLMVLESV